MKTHSKEPQQSRRNFIKAVCAGGALVATSQLSIIRFAIAEENGRQVITLIVADYSKCAGCRTCETACSAANNKVRVGGKLMNGLGNPELSNMRVYGYNPDVNIPTTCAMCPDIPCIEACPIPADQKNKRKALYQHPETGAIINDLERCIGCTLCAQQCRVGVIFPNPETKKPEHMCTLCGGDPQCVKHCPFGTLSHIKVDMGNEYYAMKPEQIAKKLIQQWYGPSN
jgi:Fe-S-cluster-containing hydrogenase component 2